MCVKLEQESEGGEEKNPSKKKIRLVSSGRNVIRPPIRSFCRCCRLLPRQVVRSFRLSGWLKSNARDAARSESIEPIDNGQKANTFILMRLER